MNIQEAIQSGKPFRRKGWPNDGIFIIFPEHDIALTLETDTCTAVDLDVQDILANDWYTREDVQEARELPGQVLVQPKVPHRREPAE